MRRRTSELSDVDLVNLGRPSNLSMQNLSEKVPKNRKQSTNNRGDPNSLAPSLAFGAGAGIPVI